MEKYLNNLDAAHNAIYRELENLKNLLENEPNEFKDTKECYDDLYTALRIISKVSEKYMAW